MGPCEPQNRFELLTARLQGECSTTELLRRGEWEDYCLPPQRGETYSVYVSLADHALGGNLSIYSVPPQTISPAVAL